MRYRRGSGSRALANDAEFGVNETFVIEPDALHVRPETLLDVFAAAFDSAGEIGVL